MHYWGTAACGEKENLTMIYKKDIFKKIETKEYLNE